MTSLELAMLRRLRQELGLDPDMLEASFLYQKVV